MVNIHHESEAAAPVSTVFAYIDDYRCVPEWMFGISEFEPVGAQDQGLGAVFDGSIQLGPKTLYSTVEVTAWEQDRVIALKSVKGFPNTSTWHFTPIGEARTRLTVDFTYDLPGGFAGKALGRVIEPFVAIAIRHTEQTLRRHVEERYSAGSTR